MVFVGLADFRYLTDALTPDEALELLERGLAYSDERAKTLSRGRLPRLPTTPGWLGYLTTSSPCLRAQAVRRRLHPGKAQGSNT